MSGVGLLFWGTFAPKVGGRPIVGGPSPKQCCGPPNLHRIAECFQFLTEGTKRVLLSQLCTPGVNLPSTEVDAARGGVPRRLPEQKVVEELMFAYQQQLVTKEW